jgi:DNA-binding transcriptional regulator YiaG
MEVKATQETTPAHTAPPTPPKRKAGASRQQRKKPAKATKGKSKKPIKALKDPSGVIYIRSQSGLTQADFAAFLGVSVATITKWENGTTQPGELHKALLKTIRHALVMNPHIASPANAIRKSIGLERAWFFFFANAFGTPTVLPMLLNPQD